MPRGKHKPGYRWPRKGDPRRVDQHFKVEKLSPEVRAFIVEARAAQCQCHNRKAHGHTWEEIAEGASKLAGQSLSVKACHGWYWARAVQILNEEKERHEATQKFIRECAKGDLKDLSAGALNRLADLAFDVERAKDRDPNEHRKALDALIKGLARERQLGIDERKLGQMEKNFDKDTREAADKISKGRTLTVDEINRLRERTFGLPPLERPAGRPPA
jgi:hypothetical protein